MGRDLEHFHGPYNPKFTCFNCRKTFRRRRDIREEQEDGTWIRVGMNDVICPDCGEPVVDLGIDFKVPKRSNLKQWEKIRRLYKAGITFKPLYYSTNAPGPGYRPKYLREVDAFLEEEKRKRPKTKGERLLERLKREAKPRSGKD